MEEIATVYARSLFEVAQQEGKTDEVREQLGQVADTLAEDQQLQVFFFSPYFNGEEKKDGLRKAITDVEPILQRFLELLVENHRMPVLFRVRRSYDALWEELNQRLPVQVTTAVDLDEQVARQIGDRIGEQTGRQVQLTTTVDPEILGGLVLRVGNNVLDASVRHRLEALRRQVASS